MKLPLLTITSLAVKRSDSFTLRVKNLSIEAGDILCVAGPNGSGKTTLVECITGLLASTAGHITIHGVPVSRNLRATKALVGFVPDDESWLIKELCAREYFALLHTIYRQAGVQHDMRKRGTELANILQFTAFDIPMEQLSHGNKKKVQLIAALMHQPQVIIVDELRNGLDPLAVIAAEQLIRQEATRGACVIAATHDLWWAERIAQHILLLMNGSIAVNQKTAAIVRKHGSLEKLFMKTVGGDGAV